MSIGTDFLICDIRQIALRNLTTGEPEVNVAIFYVINSNKSLRQQP